MDWSFIASHWTLDVLFFLAAYSWVGTKSGNRFVVVVDSNCFDQVPYVPISGIRTRALTSSTTGRRRARSRGSAGMTGEPGGPGLGLQHPQGIREEDLQGHGSAPTERGKARPSPSSIPFSSVRLPLDAGLGVGEPLLVLPLGVLPQALVRPSATPCRCRQGALPSWSVSWDGLLFRGTLHAHP